MELSAELKREMFWTMLLARRVDERAWVLHRQGRIAFHISGIGHEVAQVGAAFALRRGHDWVTPYYRDLALLMAMGMTPREFMLSLMGKREEPSPTSMPRCAAWVGQMCRPCHSAIPCRTGLCSRSRKSCMPFATWLPINNPPIFVRRAPCLQKSSCLSWANR